MRYSKDRIYIQKYGKFKDELTEEELLAIDAYNYDVSPYEERQRQLNASRIGKTGIQTAINKANYISDRTSGGNSELLYKAGFIAAKDITKGAGPNNQEVSFGETVSPSGGFYYGGDRLITEDGGRYVTARDALTKEDFERTKPAEFVEDPHESEIPTASSNPMRPRTVAATYNPNDQKLTVVFRDGTFYNYYDVTEAEWSKFRYSTSKGWIIAGILDGKDRGPANMRDIDNAERIALTQAARRAQITNRGYITGLEGIPLKKDGTPKKNNPRLTRARRENNADQKRAQKSRGRKKGRR